MKLINFTNAIQLKFVFLALFIVSLLSSCNRIENIPYTPQHSPESWLEHQPYQQIELGSLEFIIVQPSSSIFVYALGLLCLFFGFSFLKNNMQQKSRLWWGVALILWGIGALLAGTSYQAFSYEIKCAGREICTWTSWWEVFYIIFSAASIDAMMMSMVHSSVPLKLKQTLKSYAISKSIIYSTIVFIGALIPNKFLVSFELLLLVSIPSIVAFLIINLKQYRMHKEPLEKNLIQIWIILALVIGVYYVYLMLGFTEILFEKGYWFSANDVLHIGLIGWVLFIGVSLGALRREGGSAVVR